MTFGQSSSSARVYQIGYGVFIRDSYCHSLDTLLLDMVYDTQAALPPFHFNFILRSLQYIDSIVSDSSLFTNRQHPIKQFRINEKTSRLSHGQGVVELKWRAIWGDLSGCCGISKASMKQGNVFLQSDESQVDCMNAIGKRTELFSPMIPINSVEVIPNPP